MNMFLDNHRIHIGIDPSLNSTGICIYDYTVQTPIKYYIISAKFTQKALKYSDDTIVNLIQYDKKDINKSTPYADQERDKTKNLCSIVQNISQIINDFCCLHPEICGIKVYMEGISYGSSATTAVMELAGLNYLIRNLLESMHIPYEIITPMANKKFAVGIGNADKDVMVDAWKHCQPKGFLEQSSRIMNNSIKIDDMADAYFLATHPE